MPPPWRSDGHCPLDSQPAYLHGTALDAACRGNDAAVGKAVTAATLGLFSQIPWTRDDFLTGEVAAPMIRASPEEPQMKHLACVALVLYPCRALPAGRRIRDDGQAGGCRAVFRASRAHPRGRAAAHRCGFGIGCGHARRPSREDRAPRGARADGCREQARDAEGRRVPVGLDVEADHGCCGDDDGRRGQGSPERSRLAFHPRVQVDEGRGREAERARRRCGPGWSWWSGWAWRSAARGRSRVGDA